MNALSSCTVAVFAAETLWQLGYLTYLCKDIGELLRTELATYHSAPSKGTVRVRPVTKELFGYVGTGGPFTFENDAQSPQVPAVYPSHQLVPSTESTLVQLKYDTPLYSKGNAQTSAHSWPWH